MATSVYQQGGYGTAPLFPSPIIARRNPATTDIVSPTGQPYQIFQGWNNELTDDNFIYLGGGNWVTIASVVGSLNQLTGNAGVALPAAGNINIVGAGTLSFAGAGSTITGTITPGTGLISTLTGNSGGALSPTAGNMNILGNNALGINISGAASTLTVAGIQGSTTQVGVWEGATAVETQTGTDATRAVTPNSLTPSLVSQWVVGPGGAYTTIQSAIDAAVAAGGVSQTIFVKPGVYTEDLDFSGATVFTVGLTLVGAVALGDEGQCEIVGTHIPPASGTLILRNFRLSDATAIFSSAAAGTAHLVIIDAELNVTNGYTFDLLNWNGIFELFDINPGTADDGGINNTGGSTLFMFSAGLGMGTANTMNLSGTVVVGEADIGCPVNFGTGASIAIDVCQFSEPVTFSGNSTGQLNTCRFTGGAAAAITMSSTASIDIDVSVVQSSNNPAIAGAGAGTLRLGDITFTSNSSLAGTLTVAYFPTRLGNTLVTGNVSLLTAGNKLEIATGANASAGTATLVGGTATVNTTAVTASSIILLTRQSIGATGAAALGLLTVGTVVAGTSFVINAVSEADATALAATDVSVIGWVIIN